MASLCSSVTGVCVLQQHLGPGTRPPAINTSLQHNLMSRNIMNSELFWQTQPFHINTGAPFTTFSHYHRCSLLWGYPWQWHVHNINIYTLLSTHSYLPNTEDIQVNFFWHTWNMQHVTCTSHYKWGILGSTIFDTETFIHFIHWYVVQISTPV